MSEAEDGGVGLAAAQALGVHLEVEREAEAAAVGEGVTVRDDADPQPAPQRRQHSRDLWRVPEPLLNLGARPQVNLWQIALLQMPQRRSRPSR